MRSYLNSSDIPTDTPNISTNEPNTSDGNGRFIMCLCFIGTFCKVFLLCSQKKITIEFKFFVFKLNLKFFK